MKYYEINMGLFHGIRFLSKKKRNPLGRRFLLKRQCFTRKRAKMNPVRLRSYPDRYGVYPLPD